MPAIHRHRFIIYLNIAAFIISVQACNKPSQGGVNTVTATVSFLLANATNATIFESAIVKSNLDTVFKGAGPFTVFVPNDAACAYSGITPSVINGFSDSMVRNMVLYHTVAGVSLSSASFANASEQKMIMANGDSAYITLDSLGLFVNGVLVQTTDVLASNGLVHVLQQVLVQPDKYLLDLVQSDTSLSLFSLALQKVSAGNNNIDSLLANSGPYTLWAPVNDAFRNDNYFSGDDINNANPDSLSAIVLSHIAERRMFSCDMLTGTSATTLSDSSLLFSSSIFNTQVKLQSADTTSNIIYYNKMARNGVLFKIDQLLKK